MFQNIIIKIFILLNSLEERIAFSSNILLCTEYFPPRKRMNFQKKIFELQPKITYITQLQKFTIR